MTCTYTSGDWAFTAPGGVTSVDVVAVGGRGASVGGATGGRGGRVAFTVDVGAYAGYLFGTVGGSGTAGSGGANGGGGSACGGGGGRTDVYGVDPDLLVGTLVAAAAGGGGGGCGGTISQAGAGGDAGTAGTGGADTSASGQDGGGGGAGTASAGGAGGPAGCAAGVLCTPGASGAPGSSAQSGDGHGGNGGGNGGGGGGGYTGGGGGGGGGSACFGSACSDGAGGGGGGGSNLVPAGGNTGVNASDAAPSVTITYAPPAPTMSTSPGAVSFGNRTVGSTSAPQTVTVTNTGSEPLHVGQTAITGPDAADFVAANDGCSGETIDAAASCAIEVTFTPSAEGPRAATLSIRSDADSSPDEVPLSGSGTTSADLAVGAKATPNPVKNGSQVTYTVIVQNHGPTSASAPKVDNILPSGTQFTALEAPSGWACTTPPVGSTGTITCTASTLATGASAVFSFSATVVAPGRSTISDTATVTSAANDPNPANNTATVSTAVQGR